MAQSEHVAEWTSTDDASRELMHDQAHARMNDQMCETYVRHRNDQPPAETRAVGIYAFTQNDWSKMWRATKT